MSFHWVSAMYNMLVAIHFFFWLPGVGGGGFHSPQEETK